VRKQEVRHVLAHPFAIFWGSYFGRKGDCFVLTQLDFLREMSFLSVVVRLLLAMFFGGMLGIERQTKRRPAGFRTYMLVCLGATLTMLLGQYEYTQLVTAWSGQAAQVGTKIDVSRFGAQVINGIGFLGAGTIMVNGRKEVKGLTTAAGLWASACMGLAIGAGFYECVILGFGMIIAVARLLPRIETIVVDRARNMNLYVEFRNLDHMGEIITCIKDLDIQIYEVNIQKGREEKSRNPGAVFNLRLGGKQPHTRVISKLSEFEFVYLIEEI